MSGEEPAGSGTGGDVAVRFVLVAAVADNRVIGRDGDMPWHIPEDLKHFKRTTTGHPVVMGRKTYESIARQLGGPLPDRHSVVLTTRDLDLPEGAEAVDSVDSAVAAAENAADEMGVETVYVVGGATVYEQFLARAAGLVRTELDETHEGDTRFPQWDRGGWVETDRDDRDGFSFVTYERRGHREHREPDAADRGAEESDD
ncbi:dihydrofolate reductase [Haloferax sp. Atlit-6N]|uniref:dihydrofolate reductase n=1 Tax=unclassified Haloferax TaxID=2625095 RepID=UPI000E26AB9B|nr:MULTISPECIES: dihydrofolate reductase [unclassified Haloferax]RDZ51966.1 dihydrofolate reductase [Haloferax sp. Atlit-4N]REA01367.1 dihydrofolate reductase [Haloferax sp. Atlit-6N]